MQKFLNNKYMFESLNKSVSLILNEDFVNSFEISDKEVKWPNYLSLEFEKINDLLLYYTIYKSDLIRSDIIRKLLASRLSVYFSYSESKGENNIIVEEEQYKVGRRWIFDYLSNLEDGKINFNVLVLFNNIRSCLMLSSSELETQYLWSYLNKEKCN